jgi:Mlc titration factor MtfA (ptsG expression regulator)
MCVIQIVVFGGLICACLCMVIHNRMHQLKMNEGRQDGKDNLLRARTSADTGGKVMSSVYTNILLVSQLCQS